MPLLIDIDRLEYLFDVSQMILKTEPNALARSIKSANEDDVASLINSFGNAIAPIANTLALFESAERKFLSAAAAGQASG